MNCNECEAVLYLHRSFRPRRQTGRGFLVGTVFLDTALLFCAFVLATSPFVQKPGIVLKLPVASQTTGIQFNDMVLSITHNGLFFFNDELVQSDELESVLSVAVKIHPNASLILEADRAIQQWTVGKVYDAATCAGFRQIFIATQKPLVVP